MTATLRQIFLVRHCQSEANRDQRAEGRGDSVLTAMGEEQALRRALHLQGIAFAGGVVVASPLSRATQTGRAIASACQCEFTSDERLVEGDLGWMEGMTYTEVVSHVREGETWLSAEVHGGETTEAVGERMFAALEAAMTGSPRPLVLVSHGFAIAALLKRLGASEMMLANGDMLELHLHEGHAVHQLHHHVLSDRASV